MISINEKIEINNSGGCVLDNRVRGGVVQSSPPVGPIYLRGGGNPGRELLRIRWRGLFGCLVRQRFAIADMVRSFIVDIGVPRRTDLPYASGR